jgi:glutamine amidotransferase
MSVAAIVDYGMWNVGSVARALEECGATPVLTADPDELAGADHLILPGVGAFGDAMDRIRGAGLDTVLLELVQKGTPFLGLCLGMQLLSTRSFEHGEERGLGWIEGDTLRLEPVAGERVPHIGWNQLDFSTASPLFEGIRGGSDFYFVHSYHFRTAAAQHTLGTTPYCGGVSAAVARDNVFGVQFHPEKSQQVGLRLLRNFLSL